jgi:hypothetical protein
MAKGTATKEKITEILLKLFKGSFVNGKEIRIPAVEDGMELQIKVTLTAAKDLVDSNAEPTDLDNLTIEMGSFQEPSEEEKKEILEFLKAMGY